MPVQSSDYLVTRDHLRVAAARLAHQMAALPPLPLGEATFPEATDAHLAWLCRLVEQNVNSWPVDELARWVGFVQGVMVARGGLSMRRDLEVTNRGLLESHEADGLPPRALPKPPTWNYGDLVVGVHEGRPRHGCVVATVERLDPFGDPYQARVEVEWSGNAHPRQTAHDPRELVAAYEVVSKDGE